MTETNKLIPAKVCAWCGDAYTPSKYRQQTQRCCSAICARRHGGLKRRGQMVPHLLTAVQRRAALRVAQVVEERFGMLSPRERELFTFAKQHGYDQGYNAAIRPMARRRA